jgi:hypothetical protein
MSLFYANYLEGFHQVTRQEVGEQQDGVDQWQVQSSCKVYLQIRTGKYK